jgi:hypothetical protein
MTSEMGRQILIIVAKRGYTGASREVFFHNIRGIKYKDLEREVQTLENDSLISIEWVGPSNFSVMITPKGVELVKTFGEDVWHKDIHALEELDKSKHKKKSVLTQKVGYTKMIEDKVHVAEVGDLPSEILQGIDEHIIAEREGESNIPQEGSVGVPAVEEALENDDVHSEHGVVEKRISGELDDTQAEGESITLHQDEAETDENRIELEDESKLQKRVKEKRISGEYESGTPVSEIETLEPEEKKSFVPKKMVEDISTFPAPEVAPESPPKIPQEDESTDFYKQIEDAIHYGESISEEIVEEKEEEEIAESTQAPQSSECMWEIGMVCRFIVSGRFKEMRDITSDHCIMCQLLEIKRVLKK